MHRILLRHTYVLHIWYKYQVKLDARRTDGRTDGRTEGRSETNIPPNNFVVWGDIIINWSIEVIFKLILVIDGWGISLEIALRWMSLDLTDYKSTWVQAMAWCCQAMKPLTEPMLTQIYGDI